MPTTTTARVRAIGKRLCLMRESGRLDLLRTDHTTPARICWRVLNLPVPARCAGDVYIIKQPKDPLYLGKPGKQKRYMATIYGAAIAYGKSPVTAARKANSLLRGHFLRSGMVAITLRFQWAEYSKIKHFCEEDDVRSYACVVSGRSLVGLVKVLSQWRASAHLPRRGDELSLPNALRHDLLRHLREQGISCRPDTVLSPELQKSWLDRLDQHGTYDYIHYDA